MLGQKIISQIVLRFVNAIVSFFAAILVARAFAPELIGEVAFLIGISSFALMFFELGFNTTANTKIAQQKHTPEQNIGMLLYFRLFLSLLFFAITIAVFTINSTRINDIGLSIFIMIVAAIYIESLASSLQIYFVGQRHFYKFMTNNFVAQFGSSIFLIVIALYFPTQFNYAAAVFVKAILLIAILLLYFRNIRIDWTFRKKIFFEYLAYAKPLMILVPINFLIGNAERILLPYLVSSLALGIFTFGLKLYSLIEMAKKTFTSYIYTYVVNITAKLNGEKLLEKLHNLTVITHIFGAILVVGLFNRSDFLTVLFFGEAYAGSAIVTKLMSLLLYVQLVFSNYGHLIYAMAKQKLLIKWTIIGGLVLLLSIIILIPEKLFGISLFGFDYIGLPLAKLLRVIFPGMIAAIFITQRLIGTAFLKAQLKFFILFTVYLVLDAVLLSVLPGHLIWIFVTWGLSILLYGGIMLKFFTNQTIRDEVKNLLSVQKFREGLKE